MCVRDKYCIKREELCDYTPNCEDETDEDKTTCLAYHGNCDFENGMCNFWRQDETDDLEWTRIQGRTPTPDTGPSTDHTTRTPLGKITNPSIQILVLPLIIQREHL